MFYLCLVYLFIFESIRWGASKIQFFFVQWVILIGLSPKTNWKETPQNKSFYCKIVIPLPLAYLYSWKEDNFWAKHLCAGIGNILWNTLGIWGTFWELDENTLGTWKTKKKIPMPHFPSLSQEKKYPEPFWFMLHRLIGGAEFLFLHLFVTIFNLIFNQGYCNLSWTYNWGEGGGGGLELYWISLAHK